MPAPALHARRLRRSIPALLALLAFCLGFALLAPGDAGAGIKGKAKSATKSALKAADLEPVRIGCRAIGKKGRDGIRCRWVAAERSGSATLACRGTGELPAKRADLRFKRSRCKRDKGGTNITAGAPDRLAKKGLEATDAFCWGLLGKGFLCRYEARRFGDRTYDCRGLAKLRGKRFKLRRKKCDVNAPATAAQGSVGSALAAGGLKPASIQCRPDTGGFKCGWRALRGSGGWTYHCEGTAKTGAGGPANLGPCNLSAPEKAPLGPPNKSLHFGVNEGWGTMLSEIDRAARLGGDTLRSTLVWASVEHSPGKYYWGHFDKIYSRMLADGHRPLFVIMGAPCWAAANASCKLGEGGHPPAPAHDGKWRQFVGKVAARYPQARGLEIWNEPNLDTFYRGGPNPARYAQLLRLARQGVDSVGSKLPVIFGGLAPFNKARAGQIRHDDFLRKAFQSGAAKYADAIGHHSYSGRRLRDGHTEGLRIQLAELKDVMIDFGVPDKPLWITELGQSTAQKKVGQKEQAKTIARAYKALRKVPGVDALIMHRWRDTKGKGPESGYGLTTKSGKAKKVLCKLAKTRGRSCPK